MLFKFFLSRWPIGGIERYCCSRKLWGGFLLRTTEFSGRKKSPHLKNLSHRRDSVGKCEFLIYSIAIVAWLAVLTIALK